MDHPTINLTAILMLLAVQAQLMAQPILENIGDLPIGAELQFCVVPPGSIDAGPAGANVTWDLSDLPAPIDTTWQMVVPPDATPYASFFPSATHVEMNEDGSQIFIQRTDEDHLWGYVGNGLVISYSDPYQFLTRPITFGDQIMGTSARSFSIGEDQPFQGTGNSLTHADGHGTLILPNGEFNDVLRVKFVHEYSDSSLTTSMISQVRTRTYAWYDALHRSALLKIDSTIIGNAFFGDTIVSIAYLHEEDLVSVLEHDDGELLEIRPLGMSEIVIGTSMPAGPVVKLEFHTMDGRLAGATTATISGPRTIVTFPAIHGRSGILTGTIRTDKAFHSRSIKLINLP